MLRAFALALLSVSTAWAQVEAPAIHNEAAPTPAEEKIPFRMDWDYAAMRDYVRDTKFFATKPCIVYRDLWDPDWSAKIAKFDALIAKRRGDATLDVEPQPVADVKTITLHHAEYFEGSGPQDIKRMHVRDNGWSDIAYHYVIAKKTPPESFFLRVMLRDLNQRMKAKGYSPELIQRVAREHFSDFKARREAFERHKELALKDPRNAGCTLAGGQWLVYEARPERFRGAHAGWVDLQAQNVEGVGQLFRAVAVKDGHASDLEFLPDGKSAPDFNWLGVRDALESGGFIKGAYYRLNVAEQSLELVDETGQALLHPVLQRPLKVSLKSREKAFKLKKDGTAGTFKKDEFVRLSYNHGSIGVVLAGSYHEREEAAPFGYAETSPEWLRQPSPEAVRLLGQLTNQLNSRYAIEKMLAHRSGLLAEKHNCSGGNCPGDGALEVLRAFNERFYKAP